MEHQFWHDKWQQNQIGFHRSHPHPALEQEWHKLELAAGSRVLVPMCGKSNDMLWLLEQGYQVVGVELSPIAVNAFFTENNLQPRQQQQGLFSVYSIDELQIFCGDFFALQASILGKIDAVYDRGALVALPAAMRIDYAARMQTLLNSGAKMLLVSLYYPENEISGPPFSIRAAEINQLYQSWSDIQLLADEQILDNEPHLKSRGLSQLNEKLYKLVK